MKKILRKLLLHKSLYKICRGILFENPINHLNAYPVDAIKADAAHELKFQLNQSKATTCALLTGAWRTYESQHKFIIKSESFLGDLSVLTPYFGELCAV